MNEEQSAQLLVQAYIEPAPTREQATSIHLFGIRYTQEMADLSLPEILARARMPRFYVTEIRKGMKLAQYVELGDS